jgi:hypothetical protein
VNQRIADAERALGIAIQGFDSFKQNAEVLAATKVPHLEFFDGLLDTVCDLTKAQADLGVEGMLAASLAATEVERLALADRYEREVKKRGNLLDDLIERYESEKNGLAGMRGTGWACLNAATESVNHGPLGGRYRGDDKESRRFESVTMGGDADTIMQTAYQMSLEYAAKA